MQNGATDDTDSLLHRAKRYREFGEYVAARDTLLQVVKLDNSLKDAWLLLGEIYETLGTVEKARDCYKTAHSLDSNWKDPLSRLGTLEFSQKQYKDAVMTLKMYMKQEGDDIDILLMLAQAAFNLDDCKTVIDVTSKIVEIDEDVYKAWEMRGLCYARQSKFNAASVALNVALELDSRSVTALNAIGDLCYESENYQDAVSFYLPSATKRKKQPQVLFRLGTSLWFLDKWNDAISFLEQYTQLAPEDAAGWNNLGVALREKGEVTRSLECYKRALHIDPNLEVAKTNMTTAMKKQVIR